MKYTTEIEINQSLDRVIQLFDNPDNLLKWMEGLQSFEHLSGIPGQPGAKSKLKFKRGNQEFEMIETVTTRNLPHEFSGSYEIKNIYNIVINRFEKISETKTRYIVENEFRFSHLLMKVMAFLIPGVFKKQSKKYMIAFKNFAESQSF